MELRYEIVEEAAGEGGFGKVDKAKDTELERNVAIKTLDPLFKDSPSVEDKERFRREAKTLANLSHPSIPAIYDVKFEEKENEFKIIFEWIEGQSIKQLLSDRGVLSLEETRRWFKNICSALEHAHSKGVIHRDIKPANLIIKEDMETCYIVDFGISLRPSDIHRLTGSTRIGTPGYMSPEQEKGEEVDSSSDIYSLGIVLYECLSGQRPSVGHYKTLNSMNETIPPSIDTLIKACLANKENRLKAANGFFDELANALRPHGSFSKILSQGALHEIQLALTHMDPDEFSNLPSGQRVLIMARLKDLINVDDYNMRNAVASILSELARVARRTKEEDYSFIAEKSYQYGYEVQYGENWCGNIQIREQINKVAIKCQSIAHKILSNKLLQFLSGIQQIEDKERWFYHDLRILLQNLLANDHCHDDHADQLGQQLVYLNTITH